MILLAGPVHREAFSRACDLTPIPGAAIHTLWLCYGNTLPGISLWVMLDGEEAVAAIARNGSSVLVSAGEGADPAELWSFLQGIGFDSLEAPLPLLERLPLEGELSLLHSMVEDRPLPLPPLPLGCDIRENPPLEVPYTINCAANPAFAARAHWESWYVHHSHLVRHGLGTAFVLYREGKPVATAGCFSAGERYGVAGPVATLPEHRGKGFASLLTAHTSRLIRSRGKIPALQCAPSLTGFYRALGFREEGLTGLLEHPRLSF